MCMNNIGELLISTMKLLLALTIFVSGQTVIANYTEQQVLSVDSYGAVANDSSVQVAIKNSQAISQASILIFSFVY